MTNWDDTQTAGYVKNGYLNFDFNIKTDYITTNNGLYNNYAIDKIFTNSGYRRLWQFIKKEPPLLCVWNATDSHHEYSDPLESRSLAKKSPSELSSHFASNGCGLSITLSSGHILSDFSNLSSTSEYINRLIWGYSGGIFDITK